MRRAITIVCCLWAAVGLVVFALGVGSVNSDARVFVASAAVVGVGAAMVAAGLAWHRHMRWAGVSLVLSVVIPTWYAAALNLIPLAVGVALILIGYRPAVDNEPPTAGLSET